MPLYMPFFHRDVFLIFAYQDESPTAWDKSVSIQMNKFFMSLLKHLTMAIELKIYANHTACQILGKAKI